MTDELMPSIDDILNQLIAALSSEIQALMDSYVAQEIDLDEWTDKFKALLARYHTSAFMAAAGREVLEQVERRLVELYVGTQFEFLDNFAKQIGESAQFKPAWRSRALMYAQGIKAPYWAAMAESLPLPAMPGDGTSQCLTRCRCHWEITALDKEKGDYDCFWVLSPVEHCQTCIERGKAWNPLQIREFLVQGIAITDETMEGEPVVSTAFGKKEAGAMAAAILVDGGRYTLLADGWRGPNPAVVNGLRILSRLQPDHYVPDLEVWQALEAARRTGGQLLYVRPPDKTEDGVVY